jgi:hypothetical protein
MAKSRVNTPSPEDESRADLTPLKGRPRANTPSPEGDSQTESPVDSPTPEDKPQADDSPPYEADANDDQECEWECHTCHHINPDGLNQCHGAKVCGHIYCNGCRDSIHPGTRVPVIWCCYCNTAIDAKRGDRCTYKRGRWCGHPQCSDCILHNYPYPDYPDSKLPGTDSRSESPSTSN